MIKILLAIQRFLDASRYRRYGLAVLLTGLAVATRMCCVQSYSATFAILAVAVVSSAWFGGRGPGLLSTILVLAAAPIILTVTDKSERLIVFVVWTIGATGLALMFAYLRSSVLRHWRRRAMLPLPLYDQEPRFMQIMLKVEHTLVDQTRCYMLYQIARQTAHIAGDVAEVGVYKGGTAKLLAQSLPHKCVHLFDTFAGMPATNANLDTHTAGDFADTSLLAVQNHLRDCENVRFYQGFFPSTAGPIEGSRFTLVHVDADIYDSVRACCHFFYPRLEKDGVLVFDDYGFPTCPGARRAVDEFFSDKPEIPFYLPTGQCLVVRK